MRFSFTGKLSLNGMETKNPWYREDNAKGYKVFSGAIVKDNNNRAYVELFGSKPSDDKIKTIDKDGVSTEVAWKDRVNPDVLSNIASYKKNLIACGDDRKEFMTTYDAIECLVDNYEQIKDKTVTVTGSVVPSFYKGKMNNRYTIANLYTVKPETPEKLQVFGEIFWNPDEIDTTDWTKEKKITVNAYTYEYISKDVGRKYVRRSFVIDGSGKDFSDEATLKKFNYALRQIGLCIDENGILKNTFTKGKVYHIGATFNVFNGAEEVEFDESTLTENQKEAIELGYKTINDFKESNRMFGPRISVMKIANYDLKNYPDGAREADVKLSELEEQIYICPDATSESVIGDAEAADDLFD